MDPLRPVNEVDNRAAKYTSDKDEADEYADPQRYVLPHGPHTPFVDLTTIIQFRTRFRQSVHLCYNYLYEHTRNS